MVLEKVIEVLRDELSLEDEVITMDTNIQEDLGADSLEIVEVVMSLEDEFGVEVPNEEVQNMKTVGDVVKYIEANK